MVKRRAYIVTFRLLRMPYHFVLFMLDYTYSRLTKDFLPYDKNFHSVQARVQFVFLTTARLIPAFVFSITRVTGRKTRQL